METKILPPTEQNIKLAGEILSSGGLVAVHTETVYGLAANALDGEACARIFEVKGRPQDNPLIVHIADIGDWARLVNSELRIKNSELYLALAQNFWPGPLTIVLPKSDLIPREVCCGLDTVAVRMPESPVMLSVIKAAGVPLAAPSANISGRPSPTRAQHVFDDLNGLIPLIIDGGDCRVGVESTVISIDEINCRIIILRPGFITAEEFEACTGWPCGLDPAVLSKPEDGRQVRSPGMKYRHYCPEAEVFLVEGGFEDYIDLCGKADYGTFAMCFNGEGERLPIPYMEYGAENDPASQCAAVFDCLRRLDEAGAKRVYVRSPQKKGAALAAYNRLLRAAGFKVIDNSFIDNSL